MEALIEDIEFSQDSIKPYFQDGRCLFELVWHIMEGYTCPANLPPIGIKEVDGQMYAFKGNRRLYVYKKLHEYGYFPDYIRVEKFRRFKPLTAKAGKPLKIRGNTSIPEDIEEYLLECQGDSSDCDSSDCDSSYDSDDYWLLSPREIEFSQDSIKSNFDNGTTIDELCDALVGCEVSVLDMKPLAVKKIQGRWYCFDGNRRLFIFKKLDQYHLGDCQQVRVKLFHGSHPSITAQPGRPIKIRGDPTVEDEMNCYFKHVHDIVYPRIEHGNYRILFE